MHVLNVLAAVLAVHLNSTFVQAAEDGRTMRQQSQQDQKELIPPNQSLLQMQLTTGNDIGGCFERVAIGRRLADVSVTTPLPLLTDCEMKCFQSPDCRAFSFGMGRHGNGTCEMQHGTAAERIQRRRGRRPRKLEPTQQPEDPDYDLFERRPDCETPSATQQPPDEDDRKPPPLLLQEIRPQSEDRNPMRNPPREPMFACFRRLFSGRRLAERHIRRSLPTPSAMECEMACTREQQFVCEGFNFRADRQRLGRGSCELSARPHGEVGPTLLRDFLEDREYDFYERRRGGPPECAPLGPQGGHGRPPPDYRPSSSHQAGVNGPPGGNWHNSQLQQYGPMQRPQTRPPQSYGPLQGPMQNYGHQQGPMQNYGQGPMQNYGPQGPPQHFGPPQRPPPPPHQQGLPHHQQGPPHHQQGPPHHQQGPPHHGPQYGPQHPVNMVNNRDRTPAGAPWTSGSVGFYGPTSQGQGGHGDYGVDRPEQGYGGPRPGPPRDGDFGGPRPSGGYGDGFNQQNSGFGGPGAGPNFETHSNKDDDECFARVWSGQRLDDSAIRASASHPSLGGCQLECLHARDFTCRAFSFRHGPAHAGDSCLLTDRPVLELHPRSGLMTDPEFEVYERSSFGNGCEHIPGFPASTPWNQGNFEENNQLPPLLAQPQQPNNIPPRHIGGGGSSGGAHHESAEHECYAEYWPSAKLAATAVSVATNAPSLSECLARCTTASLQWQTPCRSLAFRGGVHGHNCLLSELAQRDLRPDMDFIHDQALETSGESWRLMAWDWADARCRDPPSNRPPNQPPGGHFGGSQGHFNGGPVGGGSQGGHYGGGSQEGHFGGASQAGSSFGGPTGGNSISYWEEPKKGPPGGGYHWGGGGPGGGSSHFTVSGKPCTKGHTCQLNSVAGFWSCPIDNTGKNWDYCCSPSHNCGYSEGMNMPWCYVGHKKEQWRPCSERYWPYNKDNQEANREGRLLPVAFLHRSGPPGYEYGGNSTFQSNRLRTLRTVSVGNETMNATKKDNYDSDLTPVSLSIVHSKE